MPAAMVRLARDCSMRTLAAGRAPPDHFATADGSATSRGALPLAGLLTTELSAKLETSVRLRFYANPLDLADRAQVFEKFFADGVSGNVALAISKQPQDDHWPSAVECSGAIDSGAGV